MVEVTKCVNQLTKQLTDADSDMPLEIDSMEADDVGMGEGLASAGAQAS